MASLLVGPSCGSVLRERERVVEKREYLPEFWTGETDPGKHEACESTAATLSSVAHGAIFCVV
jgi:hypothetical protein